jgi:protoheme ferro-lyase
LQAGGESFELIPCVNSHETFVRGLAQVLVHGPAL